MQSRGIFLLERDPIEAGAVAALLAQCGHRVTRLAHSLEEAIEAPIEAVDFALLERDLGDDTDATPVAERLSAAGIPYAFIVQPDDRTEPQLFPGAGFVRRPLSSAAIEAAIEGYGTGVPNPPAAADEAQRRTEIELIRSKLQQTAMRAGPRSDGQ